MADILGIFTGKNDLAKFFAIGGLFLIFFSLLYPLEKKKELDISITELYYLDTLRGLQAKEIQGVVHDMNNEVSNIISEAQKEKLTAEQKTNYLNKISDMKLEIHKLNSELNEKNCEIAKLKKSISLSSNYSDEYNFYLNLFFWSGVIISPLGFIGWFLSAYKEYKS